ncbi:restriction endonuclease subunit S [Staphylococcus epidermidis]|uniref:restriction endonuclease subunit S n=1 Tax=Staphylococcus epidermidis TaxID=1282 RepID=UPI001899365B|nr:restriction endonuclease subunit S [Staphylococcus epidermidis]MBM6371437.1 restriction endonuclease subunit S [Staphylococcus epidermidis]MCG1614349.1 restriction endonuclease subunit S [Staphylococcus epidermidis]
MEFNKFKLKELLQVNPRMTLKKGSKAKKIAMENIKEFQKKIDNFTIEEFKSGSKFQNGDTLLARITPCLENGKTAYVDILEDEEIAFGSTEFFVLRPIDNKLDSQFLYYLFRTKKIREVIIKSMTGTSGRQRAQKDAILEYECEIPTIEYQRKIAIILKNLDDKIEINKKTIANLEELSQTLFKRWFVDFEFPDEDGNPYKSSGGEMIDSELGEMPKNWKVNKLKKFTKKISSGGTPSRKVKAYWEYGEIMWLKTKEVKEKMIVTTEENITDLGLLKSSAKIINENSTVIAMYGATAGQIAYLGCKMATNQACCTIESEYPNFIYNYFVYNANYIKTLSSGSAQQNLNKKIIEDLKLLVPSLKVLNHYESSVNSNTSLIKSLTLSNLKLQELRDTLLPKLMSGEIEIPDDVEVNEDELSI